MRALSKPPRMPVLLIASLGCCTTLAQAESIDALYEKAKLEKTVALYGAGPSGSHDRWIKDFQQRFPGVTVAFTGGLSNGLNQKIDQQIASRRLETDLAIFQTSGFEADCANAWKGEVTVFIAANAPAPLSNARLDNPMALFLQA